MKKILVLCSANSARSQMAEAYLRYFASEWGSFYSAGLHAEPIHPLTFQVMEEDNIDLSSHSSKSVKEFETEQFDFLITVCSSAHNPLPKNLSYQHYLHYNIPDPREHEKNPVNLLKAFRSAREEIKKEMLRFIGSQLHATI